MHKHQLISIMAKHVGAGNGVSVEELSILLNCCARKVRSAISDARMEGIAVCGHPRTGYYIAETAEELEQTCNFLRSRAIHSLHLESRLRNIPLNDLLGQMHLRT
jgi:biotin operon repressor